MEVALLAQAGIPEEAILSIRAGTVRRQAGISSGRPFRFPKIGMEENPLKLDILQQIGTTYLVMKPGEDQYKVSFSGEKAESMTCEVEIKQAEGGDAPLSPKAEDDSKDASASAAEAKDYLEQHQILQFVQAVLQTVIKERPAKPYEYMARHFMSGYEPMDTKAPKLTDKPADGSVPPTPVAAVEAPTNEARAEAAPADEAAPVEEAPAEAAPVEEAPAEDPPANEAGAEEAPADQAPDAE